MTLANPYGYCVNNRFIDSFLPLNLFTYIGALFLVPF
jgi:hypothetical protein